MTVFAAFYMGWTPNVSRSAQCRAGKPYCRSQLYVRYITLLPGASWPYRDTHFPLPRDTGFASPRHPPPCIPPWSLQAEPLWADTKAQFPEQLAKQTNTSYKKSKKWIYSKQHSHRAGTTVLFMRACNSMDCSYVGTELKLSSLME